MPEEKKYISKINLPDGEIYHVKDAEVATLGKTGSLLDSIEMNENEKGEKFLIFNCGSSTTII